MAAVTVPGHEDFTDRAFAELHQSNRPLVSWTVQGLDVDLRGHLPPVWVARVREIRMRGCIAHPCRGHLGPVVLVHCAGFPLVL